MGLEGELWKCNSLKVKCSLAANRTRIQGFGDPYTIHCTTRPGYYRCINLQVILLIHVHWWQRSLRQWPAKLHQKICAQQSNLQAPKFFQCAGAILTQ